MSVPPVAGPFLAASALLAAAGVAKVVRPHDTAVALRSAGLPLRLTRTEALVRVGAGAEVAVAVAAIVAPGRIAALLVGLSYLAFAAFITLALVRKWPIASCGCFGKPDTEPTAAHAVINAAAALAAIWWAAATSISPPTWLGRQPWDGVPLVLAAALGAVLMYLVLTNPLAQARQQARRVPTTGSAEIS